MTIVVQTPPASEPITVAEALHYCRIDQSNQELAPASFTAALVSPAAAGSVTAGAHRLLATFVTADGETEAGVPTSVVTVADSAVNGRIALSGIPVGGSLVTARKIYMTAAGGSTYLLAATINNNTDTTATINIADGSLGAGAPATNTTSDQTIAALIQSARQSAELELGRYLITQTVDAYFDEFPGACDYSRCSARDDMNSFKLPPLQSVTSITYVDGAGATQTLAADQYTVDAASIPARIAPAYGVTWPSTREQHNAVRVRFVAGYGDAADVPQCIKLWMLQRIKHAHDNPGTGVIGPSATQFPRTYVDGLLDPERVTARI